MIQSKSIFRVTIAALDTAAGLSLFAVSLAYGGAPALALLGLLYVGLGARVFAFQRLRFFLALGGALSAATVFAVAFAEFPPRQAVPITVSLAALFAANVAYSLRLEAPHP